MTEAERLLLEAMTHLNDADPVRRDIDEYFERQKRCPWCIQEGR